MKSLLDKLKNEDISKKVHIIGIDGLGGAGKSTFVNLLKLQLHADNYNCYVLHIDDFINLRQVRYDKSKEEWECYYNIQWRYDYLINEMLLPIKNGEKVDKQIERYDKENDTYIMEQIQIPHGSVLILEGVFLQRKELKDYLDYVIYLDVPKEVRLNRVLGRDRYIGNSEEIKSKYEKRYFPAEDKYVSEYSPNESADFVLKYGQNIDSLNIRRFKKEDAEEISNIIRRNFLEVNIKDYSLDDMNKLADIYNPQKILDVAGYAHMYAACIDDTIVGCGAISSFWGKEDESILLTIFVLPELHGKGIGSKIINTLEKDEYFLRAKRIEIPSSITGCEFYRKVGYDFKDGIKELDEENHYRLEKFREI